MIDINALFLALVIGYILIRFMDTSLDSHPFFTAHLQDGKFCKSCGASTYVRDVVVGHDSETGEPILKKHRDCPNRKYSYKVDTHPTNYD